MGHATPTRDRPATAVQLAESRFAADACRHRSARFRRRDSGGGVSRSEYLLRRYAVGSYRRANGALLAHGDAVRILPVREHRRPTPSTAHGLHLRGGGSGPHEVARTPAEVVTPRCWTP